MVKKKKGLTVVKEKKVTTKYSDEDIVLLEAAAKDENYSITEKDVALLKEGKDLDRIRWHADKILKRIRKKSAEEMKKMRRYQISPVSRYEAGQTYATLKDMKDISIITNILLGIVQDSKLITKKELDKRFQEKKLETSCPPICPSCGHFIEGKCSINFKASEDMDPPVLAKTKYNLLTGPKAKQVIACKSHTSYTEPAA